MTRTEINGYRKRLESWRQRLAGELPDLQRQAFRPTGGEAAGGISDVPLHPADLSNDAQEEEVALGLVGNEGQILGEVDAALARIDAGQFGLCAKCGAAIARERLHALPYARFCFRCEQQEEKTGP